MRILMVVPMYPFPVVGGLERQAHELARALVHCGHDVWALSSRFHEDQCNTEVVQGIKVYRIRWIQHKLARFVWFPVSLARILFDLRRKVDVVHVHNISWFGAFVTLFAKACGLPVITKLPNIGEYGISGMKRGLLGPIRVALLKRSDAMISMTKESLDEIAAIGFPSARVLKVANGIPLLGPNVENPRLRSTEGVTAAFVGRLSREKGLLDLLYAWAIVKTCAARSVKLRIIGEGPQERELKALAERLALEETVEFIGYCRDVPQELRKVDLFVLPSYAEGNSNAVLEAMRAGLPIVATRLGGASTQVGPEGDRFLVPPGDKNILASVLLELIEHQELRRSVGEQMQKRVEQYFNIEHIAGIYEQAYRLLVSSHPKKILELDLNF